MIGAVKTIDTDHEDMVHGAKIVYYGLRRATCCSDISVQIFNGKNKVHLGSLLHNGPVWQVV